MVFTYDSTQPCPRFPPKEFLAKAQRPPRKASLSYGLAVHLTTTGRGWPTDQQARRRRTSAVVNWVCLVRNAGIRTSGWRRTRTYNHWVRLVKNQGARGLVRRAPHSCDSRIACATKCLEFGGCETGLGKDWCWGRGAVGGLRGAHVRCEG
jgi:hypothetical protein